MKKEDIVSLLSSAFRLDKLVSKEKKGETYGLKGLKASSKSFFALEYSKHKPLICIMEDEDSAAYMYSDLSQIMSEENIFFFPSEYRRAIKYGHKDEANSVIRNLLLSKIAEPNEKNDAGVRLIVSYPEAIIEGVINKKDLSENVISISKNQNIDQKSLINQLLDWGYSREDYVYEAGQFAVRGSIFDIYPYNNDLPYRLDFFDNDIESIRVFEVESQLSSEVLDKISLMPKINIGTNKSSVIELLESASLFFENRSYFEDKIEHIYNEAPYQSDGEGFASIEEIRKILIAPDIIKSKIDNMVVYQMNRNSLENYSVSFSILEQERYSKDLSDFANYLLELQKDNYQIFISSKTEAQYNRILEIIDNRSNGKIKAPALLNIAIHEGFVLPNSKIALFTEHQLFDRYHKYNLRSDKARSGKMTLTLKDLNTFKVGDYVVHSEHGIAQFGGLVKMPQGNSVQECVKLIYKGGDFVFVNLHSLHKLSHYKLRDNASEVQLSSLGSSAWNKLKDRAKKNVKDIARDLIKLYKARKESEGFAFSEDSFIQHEMEASFIYEATPDQQRAIEEVKADMEKPYPMDRLLTGDVGFGKTEVAIRAAFKAACDGKQVAVLVPTTLLAFQHYNSFNRRLKDLPVRVDYISRARTNKEIKEIIESLENGKIDIIIGTHRLTSKDIKFKDLGLLIVDEEQKFGVAVKEKLRKLQVNVDTLMMSATPIPRTLQFSLMGARDLSNINTAPANRYPVNTVLTRFDKDSIREAIEFELSRNGQVFFVHNRVQNIEEIAALIRETVKGVRVAVGHGQMKSKELEDITTAFAQHEYDVLVATTIIENGIDIANANTIIINNAQNYGLSELHQLRGRVGRGDRKAFCFLLTPPLSTLSDESRRRVQAIEMFSDLGSGFKIALQDIDQRGAGNALGAEQSGFILGMGYDTYQKIFKEAVNELKNEEFADIFDNENQDDRHSYTYVIDTSFESDLDLSFPDDYVPQDGERILLYRELDEITNEKELNAFKDRLIDRFGNIPWKAEELIKVPLLRQIASNFYIDKLTLKNNNLSLFLYPDESHPFYSSFNFDKLINFVVNNHNFAEVKKANNKNIIRFKNIDSVTKAIDLFKLILKNENNETNK